MTCCIYCLHGLCRNAQSFLQWLHKKWSAALVPRKEHPLWLLSQKKDLLRYFFGEYWHSFLVLSLIWSLTPMGDLNFMLCNAVCILWLATASPDSGNFLLSKGRLVQRGHKCLSLKIVMKITFSLFQIFFPIWGFPIPAGVKSCSISNCVWPLLSSSCFRFGKVFTLGKGFLHQIQWLTH